jgi:hypothetical protein
MEVESIKWLAGAGYTGRGLWRVTYQDDTGTRTYRHYAHWKGRDELGIYALFMKEQANEHGIQIRHD